MNEEDYVEIYVECDLKTVIERDTKGLYAKAKRGEIPNMTGLNSPYEPPESPEIKINSSNENPEKAVKIILEYLETKKWL